MVNKNKILDPRQYAALKGSINLGRVLQEEHQGIVDFFRGGLSYRKISKKLDIPKNYGVSERVAMSAIRYSLAGYDGKYSNCGESYNGIIDILEIETLAHEHRVESSSLVGQVVGPILVKEKKGMFGRSPEERSEDGRKGGNKTLEIRVGIHKLTPKERIDASTSGGEKTYELSKGIYKKEYAEQRKKDRIKGGKVSGKKQYENGTGMFNRTPKEIKEDSIKATLARGEVPWSYEEKDYLYKLSINLEYHHPKSTQWRGKPDIKRIKMEIDRKFHNGRDLRTEDTIRMNLTKIRKMQKKL